MVWAIKAEIFDLIKIWCRVSSLISPLAPPGLSFVWLNIKQSHDSANSSTTQTESQGYSAMTVAGVATQAAGNS